jgi:hypothetical protein
MAFDYTALAELYPMRGYKRRGRRASLRNAGVGESANWPDYIRARIRIVIATVQAISVGGQPARPNALQCCVRAALSADLSLC